MAQWVKVLVEQVQNCQSHVQKPPWKERSESSELTPDLHMCLLTTHRHTSEQFKS